ncbi:protein of unknown function [Taphrina deformans PYCC 5710]|uniref:Vps41 beta-propeller domain-containing protein n=1 Tax=Taphrina deformans (strain PYCC 5710 / ATCC 11124 / CBS 356.35 / IMI 108563 / JCM 9778 / NBRC 8474) TaxID=1097556 RepID=R4XM35_TAPDE|nr:protein of unknown function [Taphrina deformans PYCC 5710]|eukprot:CCG84360.1 protein of unknown function [Taphrina deformans PYCC 5710]
MSIANSSSDEDSDEEEPILKYSRFEGAISTILADDSVSAFASCPTIIVIGSHKGIVYILDLKGNLIKKYRAHSAAIAAVSTDKYGSTVVSAGIDGRVVVYNIAKGETSMYDYKRPLRTVAIDPEYSRNGKGRIASGGLAGQIILSEKGWMGNRESILSAKEGPIMQTAWFGDLLAWSNDQGVRVYDTTNMRMVGMVDRRPESPRADVFKARLLWQDSRTLIIGWFDLITKVVVQEGVGKVLNLDTTYTMKLDCVVSGLASLGSNLLVLAYIADLQELNSSSPAHGNAERPEIRVINPVFEEISEDALGLRGYEKLQPNDYAIYAHPSDKSFYVISPKDIVTACERDIVDHVQWLLDVQKYDEALNVAREHTDLPLQYSPSEIGRHFMDHLQGQGDYGRAASLASEVLLEDAEAWEKLIFSFAEKGHLTEITPCVPTEHPQLSSVVYEMALGQYLSNDHAMLLSTLRAWPVDNYNSEDIANAIEHKLIRSKDNPVLQECLAEILLKMDRPREALPYYLALRKPETFELIQQFHLFDAVQDNILELVLLDTPSLSEATSALSLSNPQAITLLVQHSHSIPTSKVVTQLRNRPALLYSYFRSLLSRDPHLATDYSDLQLELYAEYDREKLMELLKTTTTYSLELAATICEQRDYIPELVYILGKTGNNKKALRLIIEKLGDVQQAIGYAFSQADPELWEDLVNYSLDKPAFIKGLLENAGTAIKPITLIRRLRPGLVIEGLKDSMTKVFSDLDLQMSLSQCGSNIHRGEIISLANRLRTGQKRGLVVNPHQVTSRTTDIYMFFDGTIVDKASIGLQPMDSPGQRKTGRGAGQRRTRRQNTASKVTDCAINRLKLLEQVES